MPASRRKRQLTPELSDFAIGKQQKFQNDGKSSNTEIT